MTLYLTILIYLQVYYKEAVGAFVVFDVTRIASFEAVQKWKNDIDSKVTIPGTDEPIPVVLLANKIDMAKDEFSKSKEQMDRFCKENKFTAWFETSAKDNSNIDQAATALVGAILENVKNVTEVDTPKNVIKLKNTEEKEEEPPCAC